jgi:hypothetical protein
VLVVSKCVEDPNKVISFQYRFIFGKGLERNIDVKLDEKTLNLIQTKKASCPEWTELKFHQCPNCSLHEGLHPFCPIAKNLVDLVDFFETEMSWDKVDLIIQTGERKYMKNTTLQQGISSLLGIYMVTSECPIMAKLKPMVRYHLPFPTMKETQYRVMSMYLLAQYFLLRQGKTPDWELKNLIKIYDDIQIVNKALSQRLSHFIVKDAILNALVKLDIFAKHISSSIDNDVLDEMECLFNAY